MRAILFMVAFLAFNANALAEDSSENVRCGKKTVMFSPIGGDLSKGAAVVIWHTDIVRMYYFPAYDTGRIVLRNTPGVGGTHNASVSLKSFNSIVDCLNKVH